MVVGWLFVRGPREIFEGKTITRRVEEQRPMPTQGQDETVMERECGFIKISDASGWLLSRKAGAIKRYEYKMPRMTTHPAILL